MAFTTIVFGFLLILLGVGGYFGSGRVSPTALIPIIPGLLFILLGYLASKPRFRKHAMHAAALLALIGFIAMIPGGIIALIRWLSGATPAHPAAVVSRTIMAALMLIFLVMCVKSFMDARRRPSSTRGIDVAP